MNPKDLFDQTLDYVVPVSFTKAGYKIRKPLCDWDDDHLESIDGKVIAITGPTSGLGKQLAIELASYGAKLILIARNRDKTEALRELLLKPESHEVVICDLLDIASVHSACEKLSQLDRIDVLVNNAGTIFAKRKEIAVGETHIEATLLSHVLVPQLLQAACASPFESSDDPRVINIASGGMYTQAVDLEDLQTAIDYAGPKAYARAKRIQVDLARYSATQPDTDVTIVSMHPGWVDTPGLKKSLPRFYKFLKPALRKPEEGIDTTIWLCGAAATEIVAGKLYHDRRSRPTSLFPGTGTDESDLAALANQIDELLAKL